MIKYFCDQTGEEITSVIFRPSMFYAHNEVMPTKEEQETMNTISNLAFSSLKAMGEYLTTHSFGGDV